MTEGFSDAVKQRVGNAQNWICANCLRQIASYHHKLHNTKYNRERFPLFLNSPFNCVGLCQECHEKYSHLFKVTERKAELYEAYLQQMKGIINDS